MKVKWHQQRQRRHIIHHRRKRCGQACHDADMRSEPARRIDNVTAQQFDNTRVRQAPAHNQHQCNDDSCRVPESGKCLILGHDAGQQCNQQRDEGDEIVTPSPPNEENEHQEQEDEKNALFDCHCPTVTRYDLLVVFVVIILLVLALVFGPGIWVKRVLERFSLPADRYPNTGAEVARLLLDKHGLQTIRIEASETGDHYDPGDKTVRLTPDKMDGRSLTAVTVAAHEVGHAVQDSLAYRPMRIRTSLVRIAAPLQKLGAGILMVSPVFVAVTRLPQIGLLMFAGGFLTLATTTIIHFVTLPTEFDASFNRALPMLDQHSILMASDRPHARKLLTAAALTYVSASLMSLLNIARWFAILRR